MKFEYKKLSIALILLYAVCILFTAYVLFHFQGALIYESQVLNVTQMNLASPVFTELYVVVGLTLFVGLAALLIALDKKNAEVIYVEKKKSATIDDQYKSDTEEHVVDIKDIEAIVARGNNELEQVKETLTYICKHMNAGMGVFYKPAKEDNKKILEIYASYALTLSESQTIKYEYGEGLVGQAALEEKTLIIDDIPEGYIKIVSGLGNATPTYLLIIPVKAGGKLFGVVEIASFTKLEKEEAQFITAAFEKVTSGTSSAKKEKPKGNVEPSVSKEDTTGTASVKKRNNKA